VEWHFAELAGVAAPPGHASATGDEFRNCEEIRQDYQDLMMQPIGRRRWVTDWNHFAVRGRNGNTRKKEKTV
jgi:hypothetical protein